MNGFIGFFIIAAAAWLVFVYNMIQLILLAIETRREAKKAKRKDI